MVDNKLELNLTNRKDGVVSYVIPDLNNLHRRFEPGETKPVTAEEVRKLSYIPGGLYLLQNNLQIDNEDLVNEILHTVEPEYYYTDKEITELVLNGTLEQFLDALDFAPDGVVDAIKAKCVEVEVNDVNKRKAIKEKLGIDITKVIEYNAYSNSDKDTTTATRRSTPIKSAAATEVKPTRRASTTK